MISTLFLNSREIEREKCSIYIKFFFERREENKEEIKQIHKAFNSTNNNNEKQRIHNELYIICKTFIFILQSH